MMGIKMMLSPLALGFAAGFLLSIPPDSGSLEAINRGIHRGFLSSFLVGLGGIIGDMKSSNCWPVLSSAASFGLRYWPCFQRALAVKWVFILEASSVKRPDCFIS